jgi:Protein of unknown function (DUF3592)
MDATAINLLGILWRALMIGVATILLGFAAWLTISNINVINTHEKALAEVVSSERAGPSSSKGVNFYNVRLRFDLNGKKRNTEISRSTTNYDIGEVIPIYYVEETGYKAVAGDFWGMWFIVIVITFPGLMFLIFGVLPLKKRSQ